MRVPFFPGRYLCLPFTILYLVLLLGLRHASLDDPTSLFSSPEVAYSPRYSTVRRMEAEALVDDVRRQGPEIVQHVRNHSRSGLDPSDYSTKKRLCVGIPTVAREGARYLDTAVGSLLAGLHPEERVDIHLVVLLAHSDPTTHPAYYEEWIYRLTDEVLVYELTSEDLGNLEALEREGGLFREKGLFDYTYLLKACQARGTAYTAMLEDDVVAIDGWYHRTIAALQQAEAMTAVKTPGSAFLYLRLFYTEEFLGWNSEDWQTYLTWSALIASVLVTVLLLVRSHHPPSRNVLSGRFVLVICGVYLPLLIGLYFAAGRVTVLPLPPGVNAMNKYGCCSQALVFPRSKIDNLVSWFESKKVGFVDMLTEEYADKRGEIRWALTPSVVQHIGRKSSKGDDVGAASKYHMTVTEKLWNFAFEKNSAVMLRKEHLWTI